jgi:hypothetical protein
MMDDLLIGSVSGYDFATVSCWVNSLARSGYAGRRVVLVCNATATLVAALRGRGFEVVTYREDAVTGAASHPRASFADEDVSADRFRLMWEYLDSQPLERIRYVISVDVRDAVFQQNPSAWLERNLDDKLLNVSSEALTYGEQEWNRQSLRENFGETVYARLANRPVWNAGVIAGSGECFRDLCLNVHLLCRASVATYSDQAALNTILSMEPYRRITRFSRSGDGWACHAGTVAAPDQLERHRGKFLEPPPVFDGRRVHTAGGVEYAIVHQYDRVAAWAAAFQAEFGSA